MFRSFTQEKVQRSAKDEATVICTSYRLKVLLTRRLAQALEEVCHHADIDALFYKAGTCLTVDGSNNHMLRIEGVAHKKFAATDSGEHEFVSDSDSEDGGEADEKCK